MTGSQLGGLIPLLLAAFVVFRFAFRELRPRVVKTPQIWIRPAILTLLLVYLIVVTLQLDARDDVYTAVSLIVGAILGAAVGIAILHFTTFQPAEQRNAVRAVGSRITLAIWIGAFAIRLLARYLAPGGADPRAQLPMNCGTVALVAVAFIVIAAGFGRRIAGGERARA
jgi:hypothetical protein